MMNLSQTKLVGLTMELDLKAREYRELCKNLDKLKEKKIDPNDKRLYYVKELFQKNHDEIVEINRQIKEIKDKEELEEQQKLEQYNSENIFNKKNDNLVNNKKESMDISIIRTKKNVFTMLIEKIKRFFKDKL